jgi:hypothetical protein
MRSFKLAVWGALVMGLTGCGGAEAGEEHLGSTQAALTTAGHLHIVGITSTGNILHARRTGGSWSGFGDIQNAAGRVGTFTRAAAALGRAGLHVVGLHQDGRLLHTIRTPDGSWTGWGDINGQIGNLGGHTSVSLGESTGPDGFFLCTTTSDGKAWLTFRDGATGVWSQVQDLKALTNTNPGSFTNISCQSQGISPTPGLQVVATTSDGKMWHALRNSNTPWSGFGNVSAVTGSSAVFADADAVRDTSQNLQVVGTGSGLQFHTARFTSDGSWASFGDIAEAVPDPGRERRGAAVSMGDGVHVFVTTATGGLFKALRNHDGSWQAYQDMRTTNNSSAAFMDVAAAGAKAEISTFIASGSANPDYVLRVVGKNFQPSSTVQFFYDNPAVGPIHFFNTTSLADGSINHSETPLSRKECSVLKLGTSTSQDIRAVGPNGETVSFTTTTLSDVCP